MQFFDFINEDIKKRVSRKPELYSTNYPKVANHLQIKENNVLAEAVVDFINNDYKYDKHSTPISSWQPITYLEYNELRKAQALIKSFIWKS